MSHSTSGTKRLCYSLAADEQYEELIRAVATEDGNDDDDENNSLEYKNPTQDNTVLHVLCQKRELHYDAIKAVVLRAPHLIQTYNRGGWTPLHLACDRSVRGIHRREKQHQENDNDSDDRVLHLLIRACPEAVSLRLLTGYPKRSTLDLACHGGAGLDVLRSILEIDPTLANPVSSRCWNEQQNIHLHLWQRQNNIDAISLILWAGLFGNQKEYHRQDYLLHAACTQRVPRDYFDNILPHDPSKYLLLDPIHGKTPLHHALDFVLTNPGQRSGGHVIRSLLKRNKNVAGIQSRTPNGGGYYPLHTAVKIPYLDLFLIRDMASPSAVRTPDPVTRLFPFQTAAQYADKGTLPLSTVLDLLLAGPEVIAIALQTSDDA